LEFIGEYVLGFKVGGKAIFTSFRKCRHIGHFAVRKVELALRPTGSDKLRSIYAINGNTKTLGCVSVDPEDWRWGFGGFVKNRGETQPKGQFYATGLAGHVDHDVSTGTGSSVDDDEDTPDDESETE